MSGGYTVTGKGDYSSNSIFLPAAGLFSYYYEKITYAGTAGNYWSSAPSGSSNAYCLSFASSDRLVPYERKSGRSVRAVLAD